MHTPSDPANPMTVDPKALSGLLEELSTYPIISSLHIKLDGHETILNQGSPQIMYEFLHNQNILIDTVATNECPLLRADQMKDWLQPTNQNLDTNLVLDGT